MKNILIMEDDVALSSALARGLSAYGYDVDTATNARDAKETLQARPYDVVVTDIIIKEDEGVSSEGGLSLIHWLRFANGGKDLPAGRNVIGIIGMSGVTKFPGMKNILQTAKSLGADVTIEKPVRLPELVMAIERLS